MTKRVTGVSLPEEAWAAADELALARGWSRSAAVAHLVLAGAARRSSRAPVEVVVDGVRFVPARNGRR